MIVAVASGKGGTGKTTVAAALAKSWTTPCVAVDMDVEAPNLNLILQTPLDQGRRAVIEVPVVAHPEKCNGCGACGRICAFKGIVSFGDFPVVFPEMCHGCGGCLEVCRRGVLERGERELGGIAWGRSENIRVLEGRLRIGEAMSPPLIRQVRERLEEFLWEERSDVILDAPPGTSCPAMMALRDVDVIVLVAEATPFGLHDLDLMVKALASSSAPIGVVVNRATLGDDRVHTYCRERNIPILADIPFRRDIAQGCAKGISLEQVAPDMQSLVGELVCRVQRLADRQEAA